MPKQISDDKVFEATIEMVVTHGYAGATTKLIADSAEINEATLFRKYGSKSELVAKAITQIAKDRHNQQVVYTGDVRADLLKMVQIYSESTAKHSRLFPVIMSEMMRDSDLQGLMSAPFTIIAQFAAIIAQYQTEGMMSDDEDPILTVTSLIGPLIINNMLRTARADMPMPSFDLEVYIDRYLEGRVIRHL